MRQCWNWQTGTFEGRVSLTYGFKSRLPHHKKRRYSEAIEEYRSFLFMTVYDAELSLRKQAFGNSKVKMQAGSMSRLNRGNRGVSFFFYLGAKRRRNKERRLVFLRSLR